MPDKTGTHARTHARTHTLTDNRQFFSLATVPLPDNYVICKLYAKPNGISLLYIYVLVNLILDLTRKLDTMYVS